MKNKLVLVDFKNGAINEHFENTQTAGYILRKSTFPSSPDTAPNPAKLTKATERNDATEKSLLRGRVQRNAYLLVSEALGRVFGKCVKTVFSCVFRSWAAPVSEN